MAKHTMQELKQWQALPLNIKILMTQERIRNWVREYDESGVYVSFSGGKDSTVLVDIVEKMGYDKIPFVFVDTGLEYPEIRDFVRKYGDRVTWLRPSLNFKQVIEKYGYPFISKEVADTVKGAKKGQKSRIEKLAGTYKMKDGTLSHFNKVKWKFLLDAPFEIDSYCCEIMKKQPTKRYETQTKRKPILAQLAEESMKRTSAWLNTGCNAFNSKRPQSNPMAFWTEQDILRYIKVNNLPICSVYGNVVEDKTNTDAVDGQYTMSDCFGADAAEFDAKPLPLKTTGCKRTGCMFCGFGCYFDDDNRFEMMQKSHPKQYEYIMKPWGEGGLDYKFVINWINKHGNLNIKY